MDEQQTPQEVSSDDNALVAQAVAAMNDNTEAPPPTTEAPAPAPTATPEPQGEPQLTASEYFARLTAADRRERELKQQLAQATAALKGTPGDVARLAQFKEAAKKDPAKALEALGLNLSDVLNAYAGPDDGGTPEPTQSAATPVDDVRAQLEELKQQIVQSKTETAIQRERDTLTTILARDESPRWAYLRHNWSQDMADAVLHTAANLYAETQKLPDYNQVMDLVEEHFVEQEKSRLQTLSQREILAAKLGLLQPGVPQATKQQTVTPTKSLGTSTPSTPAPKKLEEMSDEDLLAEAVKAMTTT